MSSLAGVTTLQLIFSGGKEHFQASILFSRHNGQQSLAISDPPTARLAALKSAFIDVTSIIIIVAGREDN